MKHRLLAALSALTLASVLSPPAPARAQLLGTADKFGVLAGTTVTNTGLTVINGDLGVSPGTAVTGFGPGVVNGTIHSADAAAAQAQLDLTTAYNTVANEVVTADLTGQDLGGLTLLPGVYFFSSSAQLTGVLTLNANGDPNARFDFRIGSTLTTASASRVNLINGADGCNVYYEVGSSATLGTGTLFTGHIMALTSVTLTTGAVITDGGAYARNGAVTLDSNTVSACAAALSAAPEPASLALLALGTISGGVAFRRRKR